MHIESYTVYGIWDVHSMWTVAWMAGWGRGRGGSIGSFTSPSQVRKNVGLRALTVEGSILVVAKRIDLPTIPTGRGNLVQARDRNISRDGNGAFQQLAM